MVKTVSEYAKECDYVSYKILLSMVRDGAFDGMEPDVMQTIIDVCATVAQHKYGKTYKEEPLLVGAALHWEMVKRL